MNGALLVYDLQALSKSTEIYLDYIMSIPPGSSVKDYYKTLGVPHTASTYDIQMAYERLANQWLPERNKGNRQQAEEKFNEINEAFEVLYNRNSRSHYDEILKKGYSLDEAESTFDRFFQEHDFINQDERQFYESTKPQSNKKVVNYYEVLGITPNANLQEIKNAYRTLALKYHPKSSTGDQKKFLEVNEAYEVLSNEKKKQAHDQLFFREFDQHRTHSIFEDFFGIKPLQFPSEEDFFKPVIRKRWSRMLDRLMEQEFDWSEISSGETFKESTAYTRDNGIETRKNIKSRVVIENGVPVETKIEEYIYPNGERDVVKTINAKGKIEKINYHLKKGEETPKELTL